MGIIEVDHTASHVNISSSIFLYGRSISEVLRKNMEEEINGMWNEAQAKIRLADRAYMVLFKVEVFLYPDLKEEEVFSNKNPRNNYIRIEEFAYGNISFVDGFGSNTGYFKEENLYKGSTTAAHEYGHTLGLHHPVDVNLLGKGRPGIMYPRGTLVEAHFQYDPTKAPGVLPGGTMNPIHRRVYQQDIDLLNLASKIKKKEMVLGKYSRRYHIPHLNNEKPPSSFGLV